jgi:peptidyl-prolyl cis-trans isomerase D
MISFFRRALSSWMVLGLMGLALVAIVITGVGTPGSLGDAGTSNGERLANVGSQAVGAQDVTQRLQIQLDNMRQEQPGVDMASLLRDGAFEQVLDGLISVRAVQAFGEDQGMFVSKRLIDGEIASIAAFKGATGQFDRARFENMLDQRNITETQVRDDIARDILARMITGPAGAAARVPVGLVAPFASLMLEGRQGSIAIVPSTAMGPGTQPSPQDINAYYTRNTQRYTVPELRVIRYAIFDRSRFEGKVAPTEAEIAAYYQKNAAKYGATESRGMTQVIVQSEASANAIAAKIKSGTEMSTAAKAAGVEALTLAPQDKKAYAGLSSASVADAAFKAPKGSLAGPVKSGLGWHIVRIDSVTVAAGQSLASARAAIAAELGTTKVSDTLSNFVAELDDAVAEGQTFDEVAKAKGLTVITTPAITASGIAPENPAFKAGPEFGPILKDVFQAEPDDDAVVLTVAPERFAFVDLDRVIASAPRPLAQIAPQVTRDFVMDRASREARKIADSIAAKSAGNAPLAAAVSGAGKGLAAPRPVAAKRIELVQGGERVPPPLALMFSMTAGTTKVLEAPDKQGWYVVKLDRIEPGKPESRPDLIAATQKELGQAVGQEYAQQFTNAIKAALKVTRNTEAAARLKRSLSGTAAK